MINFLTSNHGLAAHTQDTFEYVLQGLRSVGCSARYSFDEYLLDGINIALEGGDRHFTERIIQAKIDHPTSKFFLIVSEMLTPTGFNSANTLMGNSKEHYSDANYWWDRSQDFYDLIPHVDGLIGLAESIEPGYRELDRRYFYLALTPIPGYQPIMRRPREERDIDIFFSGTLTEYRAKTIATLRANGFRVVSLDVHTPEYMREHYLSRARLSIGLKLAPDTQFTSKHRAHFHLINHFPHVFERTPDVTDLHEFIHFCDSGHEFLEECERLLKNEEFFSCDRFGRFQQSEKLSYSNVFQRFKRFLSD